MSSGMLTVAAACCAAVIDQHPKRCRAESPQVLVRSHHGQTIGANSQGTAEYSCSCSSHLGKQAEYRRVVTLVDPSQRTSKICCLLFDVVLAENLNKSAVSRQVCSSTAQGDTPRR
jgi:hypothetical protein